jgi:RNA polymerase sigma-70 factor (ECF subfamily)
MVDCKAHVVAPIAHAAPDAASEFESHMLESGTLAFRVAYSVLRNREDAEDVAQDAFVRAHQRFALLRDRARFRAWLVRMTWRLALDRRRAEGRRAARHVKAGGDGRDEARAEEGMIAQERSVRLWAAIDGLPATLRLPVVLANLEGHGLGEVAALLRVPVGTVKSRLFEARRRLREALHE